MCQIGSSRFQPDAFCHSKLTSIKYRKDFVRERVHEVLRLLLCPSFDFIKNRFKSKPKLKPESSDQPEEYSKDKVNYDQTRGVHYRGV